jgi:ribonuclease HI
LNGREPASLSLTQIKVIGIRSDFLGPASNNVAEFSAIANAVRYCTDLFSTPEAVPIPVYLFVDSRYAINVTEGKWKAKSNLKTIQHTISSLSTLRSLTSVYFRWVPGHANNFEQELSDFLLSEILPLCLNVSVRL